jgi:type III restriction enzyme
VRINIFNISKINSEVRGGKAPRIKRMKEYIGDSYFDYLAGLPDLVLLMDESHRYRASAGVRAINELKPILGLEADGHALRRDQPGRRRLQERDPRLPAGAGDGGWLRQGACRGHPQELRPQGHVARGDRAKLEDGVRLHETTKVELETYARENGVHRQALRAGHRPRHHACGQLLALIQSDAFFEGRYKGQGHPGGFQQTGAEEEDDHALLAVEHTDEPTEIVIHVNMLKEGWDVTNLYTIVPLRAANART